MSLYKDASLVMIPSAYKDGKLYSIRPTDGSGDFTFSRGSNLAATRVDVNGLIEKGRENLLLQSNQFDTTWSSQNLTATGNQTGYDSSNDAWKLTPSTADTYHRIINGSSSVSASVVVTLSVYAKADGYNFIRVSENANSGDYATFNLSTGVVENSTSLNAKIESIGNGWYRCSSTITPVAIHRFDIYVMESANVQQPWSGDGTSGVLVQDAQLELGLVATDYIETGTSAAQSGILEDMPRLDYSGGATCPSLLLEPSRTNIFTQSEYFDGNAWTKYGGASLTNNNAVSPEGFQNATKLTDVGGLYDQIPYTQNTDYTYSLFAKTDTATSITLNFVDQAAGYLGGTIQYTFSTNVASVILQSANGSVTADKEDYGNGWIRVVLKFKTNVAQNYNYQAIELQGGDGWIFGAQLEQASYPTSYIPTYGTSQTRSADSCLATSVSDVIGQTQGTIFIEVGEVHNNSDTGSTKWFMEIRKDQNNSFGFGSGGADSAPTIRFVTNIAGSVSTDAEPAGFSNSKIAIRYTAEDFKIYQNGVLQSTIAKSIGGYVDIQFMEGAGDDLSMPIKQFSAFPTALTDSECIALTSI